MSYCRHLLAQEQSRAELMICTLDRPPQSQQCSPKYTVGIRFELITMKGEEVK